MCGSVQSGRGLNHLVVRMGELDIVSEEFRVIAVNQEYEFFGCIALRKFFVFPKTPMG